MQEGITVNFRVVGIYCYFPNMKLDLEPSATIKDVHEKIVGMNPKPHNGIFEILYENDANSEDLTGFKYEYTNESEKPDDATPSIIQSDEDRIRTLSETVTYAPGDDPAIADPREMRVWQYYVSAIMEKAESNRGGSNRIIIARDPVLKGRQPSHVNTALNKGLPTQVLQECGFHVTAYNLTWRLVTINLNDGAAQRKKERRGPQRTSGRIV